MRDVKAILQVAATYIGTIVGAGFATGKEVVQFFSQYGMIGLVGILISGYLFVWIGMKSMLIAKRIDANSYQEVNDYLFGEKIGRFVNAILLVMLFGVTSVMLSGTGAVFKEQLGLPAQLGIWLTLVLCYIAVIRGMRGLLLVNSIIVPLMILFSLIVITAFPEASSYYGESSNIGKVLLSALAYAAYNLVLGQAVLVPLGRDSENERIIKWGGFLGGLGLTFILITSHFALITIPDMTSYSIPMGEIIKLIGTVVHLLFIIVIYSEIYTTLIGNVYGIARKLSFSDTPKKAVIVSVLLVCYFISLIGFDSLVKYLYPLFGYMGCVVLLSFIFKKMPKAR
ncbi:YkvI family membrane protein [Bacillus sp. AK128]